MSREASIVINEEKAHDILGAFAVSCDEDMDGIQLTKQEKENLRTDKLYVFEEVAALFPEAAAKYKLHFTFTQRS